MLSERKAIVDPIEGITRDRNYGSMDWSGIKLTFIDTGGYIPDDIDVFNAATRQQAQLAIEEADCILFMVDGRQDPTASDKTLAQFVRESGKPALMAVNKCDSLVHDSQLHRFHELGIDEMHAVSSLNGRSTGDLLDAITKKLNLDRDSVTEEEEDILQLAIVGMPNVGKSSLVNALLQKEQTIVTPIAGTTRDSIDTTFRWYGHSIKIVDTAGLRKKAKVSDSIEYYSNVRTLQSIERADIVLTLIDAEKGFAKQDKTILEYVLDKGKGLVLLVNKWDLVEKDSSTMQEFTSTIDRQFKSLSHYPVLYISAKSKQRISKIMDLVWTVHERSKKKIPTAKLNHWLKACTQQLPPPATKGKLIRLNYITQVSLTPMIFALFTNYPDLLPVAYKRYLENQLYDSFDLLGIPVTLSFRKK